MKTYNYEEHSKTIDYFAEMLDGYRAKSKSRHGRLCKTLSMLDIAGSDSVLDVGCNTGYVSMLLHERGFDVTGIDLFDYQIEIANDLKEHLGIESNGLRFQQMDFLKNDFPDNSFDYALFMEVIEHVDNPVGFLEEFMRVLKPGGHLIISTPNAINTYYFLKQLYPKYKKLFRRIESEPRDTGTHMDHLYAWDIFTFYRLLNRCGFRYVEHKFANLEIPLIGSIPFNIPILKRFSRDMIFKVQKPI